MLFPATALPARPASRNGFPGVRTATGVLSTSTRRRRTMTAFPLILLLLATFSATAFTQRATHAFAGQIAGSRLQRPNILLIVIDDLGYGEAGCYGGTIPTPNIDRIAARGVRFTSGYVTAPFCAASRAGLLTGRYGTRFGFEFNPVGVQNTEPGIGLPVAEKTLADLLKNAGYATGLVGKWHLGGTPPFHPQRRGFDEFLGFLHEGHYYVPLPWENTTTWLRRKRLPTGEHGRWISHDGQRIESTHMGHAEPDYDADNPLLRSSQPIQETTNLTDAFTRESIAFIERHAERPFFLTVAYNAVHSPMQAVNSDLARFNEIEDLHRRIFAAMLFRLDQNIGQLLDALEEQNLERQTLIFVLSDNGGPTRELTSSNAPLRGGKGELYEGGIRVPFLMSWPGRIVAGQVEQRPVSSLDIAATVLPLAVFNPADLPLGVNPADLPLGVNPADLPLGVNPADLPPGVNPADLPPGVNPADLPPGVNPADLPPLDGRNLLPLLQLASGPRHPPQPILAETVAELYWRVGSKQALRSGNWKLIRNGNAAWELYHLEQDIAEHHDLASTLPHRVDELQQRYRQWEQQQRAPLWGGLPQTAKPSARDSINLPN